MSDLTYLQDIYEQLHRHPEPALKEQWTSGFVSAELERLGFRVRRNVGGYGVVGLLELDRPGRFLALRSDMDALLVQEETNVPYASRIPGVMHACGHDSHMAIMLGACAWALRNRERLSGTLMAIFQPAEEIVTGAKAMIEDAIFGAQKPDRVVAIHNWPSVPVGSLGLQSGPLTGFADSFGVRFSGKGGHGALPHQSRDPIAMATFGVQAAFSLANRATNALRPTVLSFGRIDGGKSFNVIPEQVLAEGTVRTTCPEDRQTMIGLLHQAFGAAAALYSGEYELNYQTGVPATVNDPRVVEELGGFFTERLPDVPVLKQGLETLVGEDAAYFLQEAPGVLLLIGSGQEGAVNELHNPRFLVPAATLELGRRALGVIIDGYLGDD